MEFYQSSPSMMAAIADGSAGSVPPDCPAFGNGGHSLGYCALAAMVALILWAGVLGTFSDLGCLCLQVKYLGHDPNSFQLLVTHSVPSYDPS